MNKDTMNSIDSHGHGSNGETTKNVGHVANKPKYRSGKHEVNLQKRGFVRFQIGLILAMTLVYFALEATFANMQAGTTEHTIPEREVIEYHADAHNYTIELPKVKQLKKYPSTAIHLRLKRMIVTLMLRNLLLSKKMNPKKFPWKRLHISNLQKW